MVHVINKNLIMQDDFLPTKDFFNFDFYKISETSSNAFKGDIATATWLVVTLEMQTPQVELLQNMLKAVGSSLEKGTAVLEIPPMSTLSLSELINHTPFSKNCLIFGFNATALGWQFDVPFYKPIRWKEKSIIFADALAMIQNDINKKKQLWQGLQQLA